MPINIVYLIFRNLDTESLNGAEQAKRISTMASFVPDEIVYKHSDLSVRTYETALMFIDVSGNYIQYLLNFIKNKVGRVYKIPVNVTIVT